MDEKTLVDEAVRVIGGEEEVVAAGIFGLRDDYARIAAAGAATGTAAAALDVADPLAQGTVAGATIHETRRVNAESKGLTTRMLVAVTPGAIHILDRTEMGATTRELMRFDRATTTVKVTKFGLSRHLDLADEGAGLSVGLTGSAAVFSPEAAGDKLVLSELSASS